ncbi:hypothetical protein R1flu_006169 [Riccia fluitans]|uniref:Uncharacterized protein n=1 Tax=Riccia fluitans TaxID=41844 RepID=A0ABD1YW45_9MARC
MLCSAVLSSRAPHVSVVPSRLVGVDSDRVGVQAKEVEACLPSDRVAWIALAKRRAVLQGEDIPSKIVVPRKLLRISEFHSAGRDLEKYLIFVGDVAAETEQKVKRKSCEGSEPLL